jgi:hypothetical protein
MTERHTLGKAGNVRPLSLTLYVAGDNAFSRRAKANLDLILVDARLQATIRIVDVLKNPEHAIENRIFATPALIVGAASQSPSLVVGDLSNRDRVLSILLGSPS